jgi:hypothetical protein
MGWSDENTALAARLWTEGKSALEISKILGVTRKAVIGKMHRAGLKRNVPAAPAKVAPPRIARRPNERKAHDEKRVNVIKFPVKEVRVVGEPLMRPWTERKFGECAFPIVDGDVTYSCCADTKGHRSYCPKHQRVIYTNTEPSASPKPPRLKTDGRHII